MGHFGFAFSSLNNLQHGLGCMSMTNSSVSSVLEVQIKSTDTEAMTIAATGMQPQKNYTILYEKWSKVCNRKYLKRRGICILETFSSYCRSRIEECGIVKSVNNFYRTSEPGFSVVEAKSYLHINLYSRKASSGYILMVLMLYRFCNISIKGYLTYSINLVSRSLYFVLILPQ